MVILQAIFGLVAKSAGRILNALFGWAVRALFGETSAREQTFLSIVVGAAVAWPVLLIGIAAPKLALLVIAFVPIPHRIPSWTVRIVWVGLALIIPIAVGIAVAAKAPAPARKKSRVLTVLRGFPITVGLACAFLIMFVSVPVMRLAAILGRRKSADIPLITHDSSYHDVAVTICEVLNRHGFSLRRAAPGWWVAAPTRILGWLGGAAFRSYVPDRLEHFVSPDIEVSLYPSGVLLRGKAKQLTWAHGLIAEAVVHTEGLQTVDPKAQKMEQELHRIWKTFDENPVKNKHSADLGQGLDRVAHDLGELDVEFNDWQVIYRQILQIGRVIRGERQLMDVEASKTAVGRGSTKTAKATDTKVDDGVPSMKERRT